MTKRLLALLSIVAIASAITSCADVPRAEHDMDAQAKLFVVEGGMSNIYIYRNEIENFNTTMTVKVDGQDVGRTEHRTYIVKSVIPGKHGITAHGENTSEIEITTEEGKNHFVWLEVTVGAIIPRAKLHLVNEKQGKIGVNESELVK